MVESKTITMSLLSCGHTQIASEKGINGSHAYVTSWMTKMDDDSDTWGLVCDKCGEKRSIVSSSVAEPVE